MIRPIKTHRNIRRALEGNTTKMTRKKNDVRACRYQARLRSHPRVHRREFREKCVLGGGRHHPRKRTIQHFKSIYAGIEEARHTGYSAFAEYDRQVWSSAAPASRLLLHILDAGKGNALSALPDIAEIEFILGQKHRIAIDVVGDAGAVGGDECLEFLAIVGGDPARQLELRNFELDPQGIFVIEP